MNTILINKIWRKKIVDVKIPATSTLVTNTTFNKKLGEIENKKQMLTL